MSDDPPVEAGAGSAVCSACHPRQVHRVQPRRPI